MMSGVCQGWDVGAGGGWGDGGGRGGVGQERGSGGGERGGGGEGRGSGGSRDEEKFGFEKTGNEVKTCRGTRRGGGEEVDRVVCS